MEYDVVVVGAGSAGIALAVRLSEDPGVSVALVEAGPDYPSFETLPDDLKFGYASAAERTVDERHDWGFFARATAEVPRVQLPRGKVTGGSSAVNGQIFLHGLPEDYDGWAAAGNGGWAYDDVLPYLHAVEDDAVESGTAHGRDGPIGVRRYPVELWQPVHTAFYEAARAAGFPDCPDANDPHSTGVGPYPLNNVDGVRISTALGYLAGARGRPNLTLLAETKARRLVVEGGRAVGVDVGGPVVAGGEIVLSSGAVGSPHLLLLSGIGPASDLEALGIGVVHDLPGVGRNLQDHPMVPLVWEVAPGRELDPTAPRTQVVLRYTATGSADRNDIWVCPLSSAAEFRMYPGIHRPYSRGRLRLVSADPDAPPEIDLAYLTDERDLPRLREAVRICLRLAEHERFAPLLRRRVQPPDEALASDAALGGWIRRHVTTSQHISSTCKMGPASDPSAVVDERLRVHGVEGLHVADASIQPTIVRANTNVVSMMIGERAAAFLRSQPAARGGDTQSGVRFAAP